MSERDFELVEGSGNVFRDLGDPDADLKQAKAILAARIIAVLDDRGLSVRKAGALTHFAAADFSRIRNADLGRFTLDRLMKMLAALDGNLRGHAPCRCETWWPGRGGDLTLRPCRFHQARCRDLHQRNIRHGCSLGMVGEKGRRNGRA